jgi:hypothetical protein
MLLTSMAAGCQQILRANLLGVSHRQRRAMANRSSQLPAAPTVKTAQKL